MVDAANIPRSQRAAALIVVIALHVLLLLLFLAFRSAAPPPAQMPGALTVVSIADQSKAVPPPPPQLPSKVLKEAVQLAELALSAETDPNATAGASASGCVTLATITEALLAHPPTIAAVLRAPPETRSIADAIVIWNSGWSEAAAMPGGALELVRATVSQSLESVDEACLDEPVAGPRLVPIPAGEGTMFLVFGSGSWTWRQVSVGAGQTFPAATPQPVPARHLIPAARRTMGAGSF